MYDITETGNAYWNATAGAISGTLITIVTWIFLSMLVVKIIDHLTGEKFKKLIERTKKTQPLVAALIGMIPGCGTGLLLIPFYDKKELSIGSLMALMISAAGDAAFVIIATNPIGYLIIMTISFCTALIVGYAADLTPFGPWLEKRIHPNKDEKTIIMIRAGLRNVEEIKTLGHKSFDFIDARIIAPIFVLTLLILFPLSIIHLTPMGQHTSSVFDNNHGGTLESYEAFSNGLGTVVGIAVISYYPFRYYMIKFFEKKHHEQSTQGCLCNANGNWDSLFQSTFATVIYITVWVIIVNFTYGMVEEHIGKDVIKTWFSNGGGWTLIGMALLVGLIPGDGPTFIFASLFTQGTIGITPMTVAVIGQDGEIGLPLIASAKMTYVVTKLIILIPAFIVGAIMLLTIG